MYVALHRKNRLTMLTRESGLILTALVQLTMLPLIRSTLADEPQAARKLVNGLLGPLAVCDVSRRLWLGAFCKHANTR